MKTKIDADKVLDELMKASSSCIEVFGEKEELDEMSVNEVKNELEMTSENIDLNDYLVPEELKYEGWNKDSTKYGDFHAQLYFGYTHKMPPADYTFDGWLSKKFSFVLE